MSRVGLTIFSGLEKIEIPAWNDLVGKWTDSLNSKLVTNKLKQ